MQFGYFTLSDNHYIDNRRGANQLVADILDEALYAEAVEMHSAWIGAHHFSSLGVLSCPDLVLAQVAALTTRIRLALAVTVLPLHHPIRVAEQWATLDLLSNGRVDFAAGRGYDRREYDPFDVSFEDNQAIFEEGMEIVRRLWAEDAPISHHGKHYRFDGVYFEPKAFRPEGPRLWLGGAGLHRRMLERIVAYGYGAEAFMSWYSGNQFEWFMMKNRVLGQYHHFYWALIACNILVPQVLWIKRVRTNVVLLFFISLDVLVGMWLERFVIIVTSLANDFVPTSWGHYVGTRYDWGIFIVTLGFFTAAMLLFLRNLPAISISEMKTLLPQAEVKMTEAEVKG